MVKNVFKKFEIIFVAIGLIFYVKSGLYIPFLVL